MDNLRARFGAWLRAAQPAFPATALSFLLLAGCQGESGKPGKNLLGDDLQPPVVDFVLPRGGGDIYDLAVVELMVSDDDSVALVRLLMDGLWDESLGLEFSHPPWQQVWDCSSLSPGLHTMQAQAFDGYGRSGLSRLLFVNKADPLARPARDTLRFFSEGGADPIDWRLPDPLSRHTGLAVRFPVDKPCTVVGAGVWIHWDDRWQYGGTSLNLGIYTARNGLPDSLLDDKTIRMRALEPNDIRIWRTVGFAGSRVGGEFIIAVTVPAEHGDTVAVASDQGLWNNGHGLLQDSTGWRRVPQSLAGSYNPLIYAVVEY